MIIISFLLIVIIYSNYLDKKEYKDENIFNKEILEGFELFLKAYEDFVISINLSEPLEFLLKMEPLIRLKKDLLFL